MAQKSSDLVALCRLTHGRPFSRKKGVKTPLEFSTVLSANRFPFASLLVACRLRPCMLQGACGVHRQPFPFELIHLNSLRIHPPWHEWGNHVPLCQLDSS